MRLHIRRDRGLLLLAILVLVLAVIIIGLAVYAIYKALSRWNPRPINPDDVAAWVQEIETNNLPINGTLSDGAYFVQVAANFSFPEVNVQRSTNLIDWETVAVLHEDQLAGYVDTNPPQPAAFYRVRPQ